MITVTNCQITKSTQHLLDKAEVMVLKRQHRDLGLAHMALFAADEHAFGVALLGPAIREHAKHLRTAADEELDRIETEPAALGVSLGADLHSAIEDANRIAKSWKMSRVDVDHLAMTLLQNDEFRGPYLGSLTDDEIDEAQQAIRTRLSAYSPTVLTHTPTLDLHGKDLTAAVRAGELPWPITHRDDELLLIFRILLRVTKRNPLLTGPAGCGKTAIAWAAAAAIAGDHPAFRAFRNYRVVEVDVHQIVANTCYRGEMEAKVTRILKELTDNPTVIPYIDEIHNLHTGRSEGEVTDLAEYFKPLLAKDGRMMGSTLPEQLDLLLTDSGFERRFEPVWIPPMGADATRRVLSDVAEHLAEHYRSQHGAVVVIPDEVLDRIPLVAGDFMPKGRVEPDRSLTLLQDAVTAVMMPRGGAAAPLDSRFVVTPGHLEEVGASLKRRTKAIEAARLEWAGGNPGPRPSGGSSTRSKPSGLA